MAETGPKPVQNRPMVPNSTKIGPESTCPESVDRRSLVGASIGTREPPRPAEPATCHERTSPRKDRLRPTALARPTDRPRPPSPAPHRPRSPDRFRPLPTASGRPPDRSPAPQTARPPARPSPDRPRMCADVDVRVLQARALMQTRGYRRCAFGQLGLMTKPSGWRGSSHSAPGVAKAGRLATYRLPTAALPRARIPCIMSSVAPCIRRRRVRRHPQLDTLHRRRSRHEYRLCRPTIASERVECALPMVREGLLC